VECLLGSGRRDLRQPVEIGLIWRQPVKAGMRSAGIIEAKITADVVIATKVYRLSASAIQKRLVMSASSGFGPESARGAE
jgi:hypothetical protein